MKHWFTLVLTGLLSLCLIATSLASQSAYAQQTVTTEPPPLITQTKKLKAHNRARDDRRCQYAPRP